MPVFQLISLILFYGMMAGLLILLWRIERNSAINAKALLVLSDVAAKNAEAVHMTAEAVYMLAKHREKP